MDMYDITVIDNDYHSIVSLYPLSFRTKEEAQAYCDKRSWSGESYYCSKIEIKK